MGLLTKVLFVSDAPQESDSRVPEIAAALGVGDDYRLVWAAGRLRNGEGASYELMEKKRPLLQAAILTNKPKLVVALGHSAKVALLLARVRGFLFLHHPAWFVKTGQDPTSELAALKPEVEYRLSRPRVEPCVTCRNDPGFGTLHYGCRNCLKVND